MILKFAVNSAFSILFAAFITLFPWEDIQGKQFADIFNYIYRIEAVRTYGIGYFDLGESWTDYLKNEYIWYLVIYIIAASPFDPFTALKLISAFCAFVYHRFLAQSIGPLFAFVFLCNPIIIDLLNSQIRSTFAFSLFLLALMVLKHRKAKYSVFPILIFIHSAMILLTPLYTASYWLGNYSRMRPWLKVALTIGAAFVFAIFVSRIVPLIFITIGDRRYIGDFETKTLLYTTFWLLWGAMLIEGRRVSLANDWKYIYSIFICIFVPFLEFLGFPGFRFLALSLPILFANLSKMEFHRRVIVGLGLFVYQMIQFDYWISQ